MHIGKSLSSLPHADDEGRPTKFREAEEQDIPPAKRMCKQATKHGRHEHNQDRHSRHEPRQDRHSRREDHQERHSRREDRQKRHSRHEDCHSHREDRQDRHSHREDCQDRHSHHEDHQDRHSRRENRQDRHGHHEPHEDRHSREYCQDRHSHREDHQERHSRREDRQKRHSYREDCHSHREDRQDRHSHREDCQDRHSHREDHQDRHSRRENRQHRHGHHELHEDRHSRHEDHQHHHSHHEYCQPREHLPPTCRKTPHQQPHYQSRYQMPLKSVYMYQPPHQHPSACHSPPSMGKQHPWYYQPSIFRSPKSPLFQPPQTPFHPFYQAHSQAPVQPRYSFEPSYQPARPSTLQSSPHPSPDSPRGKYAAFLRDYYTRHQTPCTKWPPLDMRNYINLAVISNDYAKRADLVKFRKQTIHGSIDDILDWKVPIRMKNILKPNRVEGYNHYTGKKQIKEYPVTQLLIEGAPGIGKSTFAWEVCQKWGQHQLFNEYSLVVLLKFRDKRTHKAKNVSGLFYYPLPEVQSEIVHDIVLSGGHGLLLILEGFDEAPASKQTMGSIFVRLFTGQVLPKATVILTTRPSASAELREVCRGKHSRRIEIVGFGKKEIDEYIRCAFSDKQERSDFKEYLSLYPHIHSMMYVPLNSAIVTHVYESCKSSGTVVPKTMTQLYSSLIRTLLLRYLKAKEEYKDTCTNINSFKDLPQPVYDQFCEICKIAYTGIMSAETELIFQDLPSDFDPLGLMQSCPELYVDRGASVSYNFLHLTVQEYLAAYHISQQSRDEQVAFMRDNIFKKEVVVRFLAGLTELGTELWDVVREFASENIDTEFLFKENFIKLEILHLLFESQDSSAITSVLGSECVCFFYNGNDYVLQPFDWYVLGHCITNFSCEWKLELKNFELESVKLFLRALKLHQNQCQSSSTGKIKGVWLSYEWESEYESDPAAVRLLVENMPQLLVFHNLTHLSLSHCGLTSETWNILSKHTDLLQHLEYLNLSDSYNIGEGGAVNLITSLTKVSTIRELDLTWTGIGVEDCKALSELLATSKYIKVLDISGLPSDSIQLIIDGLSHNTSLEKLNMRWSIFSSENVLHLASVLRMNTRLKELNIGFCNIQSSDSVHLAKALGENTTTQLQTLLLWGNPIGSEGAVAFANMLTTNKSLAKLDVDHCSIQGEGAVCLAKALEKNSSVTEFDISGNPIGSEGAVGFASMLKKNQCLKKLDLYDDSVGVEGATELIESLKHNTILEELTLSPKYGSPSFSTLDKTLQDRITFSEW